MGLIVVVMVVGGGAGEAWRRMDIGIAGRFRKGVYRVMKGE